MPLVINYLSDLKKTSFRTSKWPRKLSRKIVKNGKFPKTLF
jgi:hypothetical protein